MPKSEEIEINKLIPNPLNVKNHSKEQINDLAIQIQQEPGFTNPIIIDEDYMIWVGHARLEAVKSLGWDKVPCITVHNMSEQEKYRYMIKDNQVNEFPWIKENLQIVFDKIDPILFEPFQMTFDNYGLEMKGSIREESQDIPEKKPEPISKLGDTYQLGNHLIMCGDSTTDFEKIIKDDKIALGITDPPFNIAYKEIRSQKRDIKNDNMSAEQFEEFLMKALSPLPKTVYVYFN